MNVKENVLFLSENVVFKDKDEVNACYTDQDDGLTPICVDAKDFGPVKRNRLYWMNVSNFLSPVLYVCNVELIPIKISFHRSL